MYEILVCTMRRHHNVEIRRVATLPSLSRVFIHSFKRLMHETGCQRLWNMVLVGQLWFGIYPKFLLLQARTTGTRYCKFLPPPEDDTRRCYVAE